jgi:phosphate:Na+ symporter
MFPFANALVKLSGLIIRDNGESGEMFAGSDITEPDIARRFDSRLLNQPSVAVETALNEVIEMGELSLANIQNARIAVQNNDQEMIDRIYDVEHKVDAYEQYLTEYLIKVNNLSISDEQHLLVNNLFHAVIDIERVSDHAENLAELASYKLENNIVFSEHGTAELDNMWDKVIKCFKEALRARETKNWKAMENVFRLEDEVDDLEDALRDKHIQRLSDGLCTPSNGVVFLDILSNLERMSDHAKNIVDCIQEENTSK